MVDRNGIISTVAGNGTAGVSGEGGPATNAQLAGPVSVAVDVAGNLYIADSSRVCKVANGIITKIMTAVYAQLAVDTAGNVYFDPGAVVSKLDSNGVIITVAGAGSNFGTLVGSFGDRGPATTALLRGAGALAVDTSGDIFIADGFGAKNRVREVSNGIINTIVGSSPTVDYSGPVTGALFDFPADIAVDGNRDLYLADYWNYRVRKISNGVITTIAGNGIPANSGDGGPATGAAIGTPAKLAADVVGDLYIANYPSIRKIDTQKQ
jgi:hypothetical protein